MTRPDLMALAEQERASLLELLQGLAPALWDAPSLCTEWRVRDVAIHVVSYDELSRRGLVGTFLRGGLRAGRVNDVALRRCHGLEPADIIDVVGRNLRPHGLTAGFGGAIALTDGTIHQQDIRRPLGLARAISSTSLVPVLDFVLRAPTLPAKKNSRGLRLTADDVEWTSGSGPGVTGPGEALLMALAGRPHALDELDGEGLPVLRTRLR